MSLRFYYMPTTVLRAFHLFSLFTLTSLWTMDIGQQARKLRHLRSCMMYCLDQGHTALARQSHCARGREKEESGKTQSWASPLLPGAPPHALVPEGHSSPSFPRPQILPVLHPNCAPSLCICLPALWCTFFLSAGGPSYGGACTLQPSISASPSSHMVFPDIPCWEPGSGTMKALRNIIWHLRDWDPEEVLTCLRSTHSCQ